MRSKTSILDEINIDSLVTCIHEGMREQKSRTCCSGDRLTQAAFNSKVLQLLDILTKQAQANTARFEAIESWLEEETSLSAATNAKVDELPLLGAQLLQYHTTIGELSKKLESLAEATEGWQETREVQQTLTRLVNALIPKGELRERRIDALQEQLTQANVRNQTLNKEIDELRTQCEQLQDLQPTLLPADLNSEYSQSFDYFAFEARFRGTPAEIKDRQRKYVPLFEGRKAVVDLGCGRGEFLELMKECEIDAVGVDSNTEMIDACKARALNVAHSDVFDYLDALADSSIGGFFCAQLVEHLTPEQVGLLLHLCTKKLKPGGLMLFETINPGCPQAMGNFYLDPTHVRPVPPMLLQFMIEQGGMRSRGFIFSAPIEPGTEEVLEFSDQFPSSVLLYQDYATFAEKVA